ncbi:hypothetical protein A6F68_00101 [Tsuneonella dongtanensis]|uniref:Uncharacterized protein n=1 Tax=Tsuneonella dongtanensis TaxID=692370 RepID=A0A1B2A8Y6_9SPHN|nr:hypothetical protein A6F68_00101 [Tsuneonella dongtanensis]
MFPPKTPGIKDDTLPSSLGGCTAITPKNGRALTVLPHGNSIVPPCGSTGKISKSTSGSSSGSTPLPGPISFQAKFCRNRMSSTLTDKRSPGCAPSIAIGPVRMCGPISDAVVATISRWSDSIPKRSRSFGIRSSPLETVLTTTTSPGFTVTTAGKCGSKKPQCVVAGEAGRFMGLAIGPIFATESGVRHAFTQQRYIRTGRRPSENDAGNMNRACYHISVFDRRFGPPDLLWLLCQR